MCNPGDVVHLAVHFYFVVFYSRFFKLSFRKLKAGKLFFRQILELLPHFGADGRQPSDKINVAPPHLNEEQHEKEYNGRAFHQPECIEFFGCWLIVDSR